MNRRRLFIGTAILAMLSAPVQADTLRDALVAAYQTNPT